MSRNRRYLKVEVTAQDIEKGRRGDCKRCPIYRAFRRAHPKSSDVSVPGVIVHFTYDGTPFMVELPFEAEQFITKFDAKQPVKPFTFKLDAKNAHVLSVGWSGK